MTLQQIKGFFSSGVIVLNSVNERTIVEEKHFADSLEAAAMQSESSQDAKTAS